MRPVVMDVETRSSVDLGRLGGRRYADACQLLCGAWMDLEASQPVVYLWAPCWATPIPPGQLRPRHELVTDELVIEAAWGPDTPPWLAPLASGRTWAAHNADGFDAHVWGAQAERPQPARWSDPMHAARAVGLPAGLDALLETLLGVRKEKASDVMLALCKPCTKGRMKGRYLPFNASNVAALLRYQVVDVLLLAAALPHLETRWRRTMTAEEGRVLQAARTIDARGVGFDGALAERVCDVELELRAVVAAELHDQLSGALGLEDAPGEPKGAALRALLRSQPRLLATFHEVFEAPLPNVQRGTLESAVEEGLLTGLGARLAQARVSEVRITSAKLARGLELVGGQGRIRDTLRYYGAHTGRWAGQRVQLHNLPRGVTRPGVDALVAAVLEGAGALVALCAQHGASVSDALGTLVRACFVGDPWLTVADLSNIEARVLPWLAGDREGVAVFERGEDPYVAFARLLWPGPWLIDTEGDTKAAREQFDLRRKVGKVGVLASGYGAGAKRIGAFAAGYRLDFAAADLTAEDLCEGWRDANPRIAGERTGREWQGVAVREGGFWRELQDAFWAVATGAPRRDVGALTVERWRDDALCVLPSGRALVYPSIRVEDRPRFGTVKPGLCCTKRRGRAAFTADLYGGLLAENVTQATARDFFAWGLVTLEERGLPVVLHVHDEALVASGDVEGVLDAMTTRPSWAPAFPLGAAGFRTHRYAKAPPPGENEVKRESGGA